MVHQINDIGEALIRNTNRSERLNALLIFPAIMLIAIWRFSSIHDFIPVFIGALITTCFGIYALIYFPLIKRGRLINLVITDIEFIGDEYTYHTAQTLLYKSKEVKGKITELKRAQSDEFSNYTQRIIVQHSDNSEVIAFIIKDFFDDSYDEITKHIV